MQPSSYVPSFYFYKLADAISAPYTSLDAYRAGAIDSSGNLLKPVSSIDSFEFLVIKLKQIFDQLPYGTTKAKLSNYLATLNLFSEEVEAYEITQEQFHCLVEGIICHNTNNEVSYLELLEDMGTGGGAGALGVPAQGGNINQGGVSGYDIKMKLPLMKRKKGDYFDNCEIFDVCPEEFNSFMNSKQWKDVPDSETKNYLRRFQRRNKDGKIGVRGLNPVSGEQDLFWITYPAKNFMEEVDLSKLNILFEDVKTTKQGYHAGHVLERLISNIGTQEDYDLSELDQDQTEYVGRMVDWVNGFHAASTSGEGGHGEQWIDLGLANAQKRASRNDSKGPKASPDGFRYDPTVKSKSFEDRLVKVDYGTDRKPVAELSRKRKGLELGGEILALPAERSAFKKAVKDLIQSPEIESKMRSEMESQIQTPQTIAHKTFTDTKKPLSAKGFIAHQAEQLRQIVRSRLFGINPTAGKPTENEPHGRQGVKSLDLRVRKKSSPSVGSDIGYDEIRSTPGGDAPKEAISVSLEAIDHLFDQIPDTYVGKKGLNKNTLRQYATKVLLPHMERGRYPLELPSSKTIST
jgi:hypothetical protein